MDDEEILNTLETLFSEENPAVLENEALGEEYDEELVEIFMKQLQENVPFLQIRIAELASSIDKQDVLSRCSNAIKNLHSSANYMGYEKLAEHYLQWQKGIDDTENQLSKNQAPDCTFMTVRLDELIGAYPEAITGDVTSDDNEKIQDTLDTPFSGETPANLEAALSDAFAEPLAGREEEDRSAGLGNETLGEDYDVELLSVFMQQLNENIPYLYSLIVKISTSSNKQDDLNQCRNSISTLKSSANYMGYEKLTNHYSKWQQAIEATETQLAEGQKPDLSFMQSFLDEIVSVYPQAMEGEPLEETSTEAIESLEGASPERDDEYEDITDTVSSMLTSSSVLENKEDSTIVVTEIPTEKIGPAEAQEDSELLTNFNNKDQELFNKLSVALDASLEQAENIPLKPMHDVIEEMIAPSDKATIQVDVPEEPVPPVTTEQVVDKVAVLLDAEPKKKETQQEKRKPETRQAPEMKPAQIKQSMRVDVDKIDFMMNQVGELVVSRAYFAQLFTEMKDLQQNLFENSGLTKSELKPLNEFAFKLGEAGVALGRVSNELQEGVMKVRMLPIDQLFKRYPRLVRDLIHKTDKQVKLETRGKETELDKMVIEEISDPLIHIIRNAVDHGIETVSERKRLGKPESGTLTLEAYHESDHIVIEVTDDGRGLDVERIKKKAMDNDLYSSEDLGRMTQSELMYLVMQPGFSTAEKTTKTSGRGVGMDVVKKNIEKLNGSIEIETKAEKGTRIRIKIPLTMAIIQALMVRVGNEKFTIPLRAVEETLRIFQQEISGIEGVDVIPLRNTTMPIFRLSQLFGIKRKVDDEEKLFVVVVKTGIQSLGLVVDELLGQEEVVIKPLADYLRHDSGFSGATILGDGGISLILDIPELMKMTTDKQVTKQKKLSHGRRLLEKDDLEKQAQVIH